MSGWYGRMWTWHLDYKREKKEYPIFEYCIGPYYCQMSSNIDTIKLYVTLNIRWVAMNCFTWSLVHLLVKYLFIRSCPDVQLFNLYYPVKQIDRAMFVTKVGWFRPSPADKCARLAAKLCVSRKFSQFGTSSLYFCGVTPPASGPIRLCRPHTLTHPEN